jgi:hypothetical protein
MEMEMAEIMELSRRRSRRAETLAGWWARLLGLGRSRGRPERLHRIDEQAWSGYMLRDVGLDRGHLGTGRDPRDLPFDWR